MRRVLRILSVTFIMLTLVIGYLPLAGSTAIAASETITGAPKDLTVTSPAEGEKNVTVSWTPDYESGIDRDCSIIVSVSEDNQSSWEPIFVQSFDAGAADIRYNSYAAVSKCTYELEYGKTYYFKAAYYDSVLQQGPDSNVAGPVVCKEKPADTDSSDQGGSGTDPGGSDPGSSDSGTDPSGGSSADPVIEYPSNSDVSVAAKSSKAGTVDISYITVNDGYSVFGIQVEYNGKVVIDADSSRAYSDSKSIKVPYGKSVTLKYRVYRTATVNADKGTRVYAQSWKTLTAKSAKLKKPALKVTKISSSRVGLVWTASPGATGYKIYKGNKVVKTVKGSKTRYIYKKAGAGNAKYAVQPVIKNSLMKKTAAGPKSKLKKGGANKRKYNYTTNVNSIRYANIRYSISQISLKGSTYTVTGYVLNNRIFDLQKFKKLQITIYCDGKVMAKKTFRNLKCPVKAGDYKKFTVKVRGKGGVDFANAEGNTYYATWEAYWKTVGASK